MQIGFVNFSQEELAKKNKVLQMVRDQTAIDELGFGRIRDAFANLMFPGMSTLQRRAKYFAVMPSLFFQATQKKYASWREVRDQIVRWEIRLTEMLLTGAGSDEDKNGITGSSVLAAAKKDSRKFVKYDPTYIYMSGLRTFGMVKSDSNIYRLIYERSRQNQEQAVKHKSTEDEIGDSEDRNGLSQFFSVCDKYNFDNGKELPLNLTLKEAKYLKEHIEASIKSANSLLAFILRNNIEVLPDYDSLDSKFQYLPEEFRMQYQMGRMFSHFAYVVQLRYNHIVATFNEQSNEANKLMREIEYMINEYSSDFTCNAIHNMLMFIRSRVTESTVIAFCEKTIQQIEKKDWEKLDELIVNREKVVKPGRCKLRNPKYKGEERLWPKMMSFRWNEIVYQVINEIREAK